MITAETANDEQASEELRALTQLGELQSRAFVSYCGLPEEFPHAESAEDVLAQSNWQLARTASVKSAQRPDPWQLADSALELAIGVSALLGGVYGTRAVRFLKDARSKSQALKEVIPAMSFSRSRIPRSQRCSKKLIIPSLLKPASSWHK